MPEERVDSVKKGRIKCSAALARLFLLHGASQQLPTHGLSVEENIPHAHEARGCSYAPFFDSVSLASRELLLLEQEQFFDNRRV